MKIRECLFRRLLTFDHRIANTSIDFSPRRDSLSPRYGFYVLANFYLPTTRRVRLGKKREEMSSSKTNLMTKNPSVAGNSTSSTTSAEEDSGEDEDETLNVTDSDVLSVSEHDNVDSVATAGSLTFESLFPR